MTWNLQCNLQDSVYTIQPRVTYIAHIIPTQGVMLKPSCQNKSEERETKTYIK